MDGILLIDKDKGVTSRDIVNQVIKKFDIKKVGHTGTLDPLATGVLVVCVGKATKLVNLITAKDKEYIASVRLGILTDTLDISGNILKVEKVDISDDLIIKAINNMQKTYMQDVPIYSAVKINGKKLYEYARENINVELPKKEVTIYDISLVSDINRNNNYIDFKIKCKVSKGTYIRSLINDLARSLNTIGIMTDLRRIKQGNISVDDCKNILDISPNDLIKPIDILSDFDVVKVDNTLKKDILNGKIILDKYHKEKVLFIDENNKVLAIYKKYEKENNMLKPDIMLGGI